MATLPGLPARNAKRKFDAAFIDSESIDEDILNARVDKAAKTAAHLPPSGAGARSTSAPAVGWTPSAGSGQIIYDDVTVLAATDAWMDPTQKGIRLVYPLLNPA